MSGAPAVVWRDGEQLFSRATVARDPLTRMIGLLARSGVDREEAVVFPRCRSIHTFFMRFPIDVAFLKESGEVVKLFSEVSSGRLLFGGPESHSVIESGARVMEDLGISLGQRLSWTVN